MEASIFSILFIFILIFTKKRILTKSISFLAVKQ